MSDRDYDTLFDILDDEERLRKVIKKESREEQTINKEIIVDAKTGLPRQAGASQPEGEFIRRFRQQCERRLYVFAKGVMGRDYLTQGLHLGVCDFLQRCPPFRKLLLMPRETAKTSIVSHCLPIHIIIQPSEHNIYFPGQPGVEQRILLCGESESMAQRNLRVIDGAFKTNQLLRTLWPHCVWPNPQRPEQTWNSQELIVPRAIDWPDSTIKAIGVGSVITGARPTVEIKDDLVSIEAANSEVVMEAAIEWHKASRALMEEYERDSSQQALEFIIGTRWANWDIYQYILDNDLTVESLVRALVENGEPIWPERITPAIVEQKKKEFGSLFWLLYMNRPDAPELADFNIELLRQFVLEGTNVTFEESLLDEELENRQNTSTGVKVPRGAPLNMLTMDMLLNRGRGEYLRLKYS